ncbi:MAG TPA: S8 family serine peptidase [Steroidobacteraceae bacterium]|nr:S8 family serine peptidase [Steroidobacteraceae bacterium]
MAQDKQEREERGMAAAAKKSGEADESRRPQGAQGSTPLREPVPLRESAREAREAQAAQGGTAGSSATSSATDRRREHYLIGARMAPGAYAFAQHQHPMDGVVEYLRRQEGVEVIRRVKLGGTQPFTVEGTVSEVVVAEMDENKAQRLRTVAPPDLIIEHDAPLVSPDCLATPAYAAPVGTPLPMHTLANELSVRVLGLRDQPLAGATVLIDGGGLPAQALTDEAGVARLTYFGGSIESVHTLFVRGAPNHWDRVVSAPRLATGHNTIRLRPLSELFPDFPRTRLTPWGQRLMGMDPTAGRFSGSGIRIGLIDSGCDNRHPLLRQVAQGRDFTRGATDASWTEDLVWQGTHCAGIINAALADQGIAGCAPAAELHVFKVMPEGRVSDLLAAIDACIERELDIIHIGVLTHGVSELAAQKLLEARRKGIACIVAAGSHAGMLGFPATLPGVMAVAAVGRLRQFPADSSHVLNVIPQLIGGDDVFAARFSGAGPQVAVCAPGVAVISAVPGGGYVAADGTAAAAAHVTGFAALVLAHHPVFQQEYSLAVRSEQRVQALFDLIRASAVPHFADPQRGAGVPDLQLVPGSQGIGPVYAPLEAVERPPKTPRGWPGYAAARGWPWPPAQGAGYF